MRTQVLYGTKGRLDATFDVVPRLQGSDAVLEVTVHEGPTYTMGTLNMTGVDAATTARLRPLWTLKEGDVYDTSYPRRFNNELLKTISPDFPLLWVAREVIDHSAHKVDVIIEFRRRPGY